MGVYVAGVLAVERLVVVIVIVVVMGLVVAVERVSAGGLGRLDNVI